MNRAQNRPLADEAATLVARFKSVSDYVTADRIEQASADEHQVEGLALLKAGRAANSCAARYSTLSGTQIGLMRN